MAVLLEDTSSPLTIGLDTFTPTRDNKVSRLYNRESPELLYHFPTCTYNRVGQNLTFFKSRSAEYSV